MLRKAQIEVQVVRFGRKLGVANDLSWRFADDMLVAPMVRNGSV
jgi:hypothetical protein